MRSFSAITHLDKRYLIVLGACLTQFMIVGLLFSYGLFFKYFEVEFGWSRTLLSSCMSFAFLVMGVLGFFGGCQPAGFRLAVGSDWRARHADRRLVVAGDRAFAPCRPASRRTRSGYHQFH